MSALERETSQAVQDYAKEIYGLERRSEGPVTTNALAERLGVTPASASAMLKKLDGLGIVAREPYHGVRLTKKGERIAMEVMRHHRLIELYLAEALELPWDRVHDEAERLEHAISPELSDLIAIKLGNPTHDPHGDPIPTRDGHIEEGDTVSLDSLAPGERGTFVRISDANPEMLRYLSSRGIAPGMDFEVVEKQPFEGPLVLRFGNREHAIGGSLGHAMRVELAGARAGA
jgi:DtxR family transcriptional regulator, Mn-dependent transcriptional regulator